uniref:Protein kinase domain-containing protein n=1 Tax=viral metagenome TaxID=1070528 RepID=A0A6C0IUL8_9ZZZZ
MSKIDKYKILEEINSGAFGTVFLVKKNKKKYALKIEKILKTEAKVPKGSPIWNENDFCKKIANRYPTHFMKLYTYDIITDCTHKQKRVKYFDQLDKDTQKDINRRQKSTVCVRRIYSLISGDLENNAVRMCKHAIIMCVIQVLNAINIMHSNGYVHQDIHNGNIGYIETTKKYLLIGGSRIPTYGKIYKLIDYGRTQSRKFMRKKEFENAKSRDMSIIPRLLGQWIFRQKHWEKAKRAETTSKKHPIYKKLRKQKYNHKICVLLFEVLYPETYQKYILGRKFKRVVHPLYFISESDMVSIIKNLMFGKRVMDILLKYK